MTQAKQDGKPSLGGILTVRDVPPILSLYDYKDALTADGLYYASWMAGSPVDYVNEDGKTVDLYDAQLTLLLYEAETPGLSSDSVESWLSAAHDSYEIQDSREEEIGDASYRIITYTMKNAESPWKGWVSAFAAKDRAAVCAEFTVRETFREDPKELLSDFLSGLTFTSSDA